MLSGHPSDLASECRNVHRVNDTILVHHFGDKRQQKGRRYKVVQLIKVLEHWTMYYWPCALISQDQKNGKHVGWFTRLSPSYDCSSVHVSGRIAEWWNFTNPPNRLSLLTTRCYSSHYIHIHSFFENRLHINSITMALGNQVKIVKMRDCPPRHKYGGGFFCRAFDTTFLAKASASMECGPWLL